MTRTGRIVGLLNVSNERVLQIRACVIDRYPVLIGAGLLDQVGEYVRKYFLAKRAPSFPTAMSRRSSPIE